MTSPVPPLAHLLHRLAPDAGSVSDADLLGRYAECRDEAAFELLLWRHGEMVWGVCRRVAADRAAAEDAFQATALALARHAGAIRGSGALAGWLYRVAYRSALATRSRRREEVGTVPERPATDRDPAEIAADRDLAGAIDSEIHNLPEVYRTAFVLCELEGRPNAEAARALGCAIGTVESRLTRARARLRDRLARRGVTLSALAGPGQVPTAVRAAALGAATNPASASAVVQELAARSVAGAGRVRLALSALAGVLVLALAFGVGAGLPLSRDLPSRAPAPLPLPAVFARLGDDRFRHPGPVFHAAFGPRGKVLATASLGNVSLWDSATGRLLRRIEKPNEPFSRVAFGPDGKVLYVVVGPTASGCDLLTLDVETGKERGRLAVTKVAYHGAEFSPDAGRLAVFSLYPHHAVLIDPAAGKELVRVPAPFRGNTLSPDGKALLVAGGNESVRVVDSTTGKEVGKVGPYSDRPEWVRLLPAKAVLLGGHTWMQRWDLKGGKPTWAATFFASGRGLEVSPDGKRVVHVSPYTTVVLDTKSGKILFRVPGLGSTSARFSPDSATLAIASPDGTVRLLDATTGKPRRQSPGLSGIVSGLTFSADGRRLMACADRWLSWDLAAEKPSPRPAPLADFNTLAPNGRVGVRPDTFNRGDTPAEFIDPVTGKLIARFAPPETGYTVVVSRADYRRGLFSGDGRRFVGYRLSPRGAGGQQKDLGLAVWDTSSGKRLLEWNPGNLKSGPLAVSPDGKAVVVHTGKLALWAPEKGRILWSHPVASPTPFLAFTAGGARLVLQEIYLPQHPGIFNPLALLPGAGPLLVLDTATGKELRQASGPALGMHPTSFAGGQFYITPNTRAVSPDGRTAAVSGFDGTIYLWDLTRDRELTRLSHPGPVHDLAFSHDGRRLAAASLAAPVMVYNVPR